MRHTLCHKHIKSSFHFLLKFFSITLTLSNFNIVNYLIPIKKIYGLVNHIDDINKSHQGPYPDGIYPLYCAGINIFWLGNIRCGFCSLLNSASLSQVNPYFSAIFHNTSPTFTI